MDMDFVLDMRERTFEKIGGIWHRKMRMTVTGKKPRQIRLQTSICTAESLVREVPFTGDGIDCFFAEKIFPSFMPEHEPMSKTRFICLRQQQDDFFQFFSRLELWLPRDVAQNNHDLMELTHLDGNVRKGLQKPSTSVAHNACDMPSSCLQFLHACDILSDCFIPEKLPEKILPAMRATKNHDAEYLSDVLKILCACERFF